MGDRGQLITVTSGGEIRWKAPAIYQDVNGVPRQINGGFTLLGTNRVGFRIRNYDPRRELVIDPALVFSTYLGGSQFDLGKGIAVDPAGNVYVAGVSRSLDLAVTRLIGPAATRSSRNIAPAAH